MFGNLLGWIISAILGALMAASLVWSARPLAPTPPSNGSIVNVALAPVKLPATASVLVPANDPCDATDAYRAALADFQNDPGPYEAFRQHPTLEQVAHLGAVQAIAKSAHCSSANLFRDKPGELINYQVEHPSLEAYKTLGNLTIAAGLLFKTKLDYANARTFIDGGFSLGAKLFAERLTFEELGAGLGLMQGAAKSLQSLAKDKGDAGLADVSATFVKEADESATQLTNAYKIVGAIDESFAGPYTGDIFKIALSPSADPMWRVEAIKHIGHYKFNAARPRDEKEAGRVLGRLVGNGDLPPAVHKAAVAARELTVEDHRRSR